jgi:hypothetical protein
MPLITVIYINFKYHRNYKNYWYIKIMPCQIIQCTMYLFVTWVVVALTILWVVVALTIPWVVVAQTIPSYDSWININLSSNYKMYVKFVSDLWQVSGFLHLFQHSPPIKLTDTMDNLYLVSSGIEHQKPQPLPCYINDLFGHIFN